MENRYSTKRKYSSFLISLLVHLLLLALLIRTALKLQQALPEKALALDKRTTPAQVSFSSYGPPLVSPSVSFPTQTTAQLSTAQLSVMPELPVESVQEQVAEIAPSSLPDAPVLAAETPPLASDTSSSSEIPSISQESSYQTLPASSPGTLPNIPQSNAGIADKKKSRFKRRRAQLPQGVTGALFVEAFKQVAHHEGSFGETRKEFTQGFGSSEGTSGHVQQRLDEWREYNYRKKIFEALVRACKLSKSYVYADTDFKQEFMVRFIISVDGTFQVSAPDPITGSKAIDDYLTLFFSNIDFPPLPKHLNRDFLVHPITIKLTLNKGGNYVQLQPLND